MEFKSYYLVAGEIMNELLYR